jgi:sulfonate transport system substrate-binding protein
MELWSARDGIKKYNDTADFLKAVAKYNSIGAKIYATYVYDRNTGLKLFGKTAFYVKAPDGKFESFLLKDEATAYAKKIGGKVVDFKQAWQSVSS